MRHIKIFEEYKDEIDPSARDFFDLSHTITLDNGYKITGPLENKEEAEKIAKKINFKFIGLPDTVYSNFDKIMDQWKEDLAEIGYIYPNYKVGVVEYSDGVIRIWAGKEYEEIEGVVDGVDYSPKIGYLLRKMGATHIYIENAFDEDTLRPVEELPTIEK